MRMTVKVQKNKYSFGDHQIVTIFGLVNTTDQPFDPILYP
jgi:hypothetical protein